MKKLKVVFFGTPEFAKESLNAIENSRHEVVGVVTVADKGSGRGQKIHKSAVKEFAEKQNLPLFQPTKLRDPKFLEKIKALEANVFVVVAFRMMPQVLYSIPHLGTFNLHASLLPDYRGAAPINYAIINGETETGVTSFFINENIDEGNILLQEKIGINPVENAGELHDKLMQLGAQVVVKTLDGLAEGNIQERKQPEIAEPKMASKIFKEDLEINWNLSSERIYNFVRGMSPYPVAFTNLEIDGEVKSCKIFSGIYEDSIHQIAPGTIEVRKTQLCIYTLDGVYFPLEVQLAGKKKMPIKDFLNGLQPNAIIKIISTSSMDEF